MAASTRYRRPPWTPWLVALAASVVAIVAVAASTVATSATLPTTAAAYDYDDFTHRDAESNPGGDPQVPDLRQRPVAAIRSDQPDAYDDRSNLVRASARTGEYRLAPNTAGGLVDDAVRAGDAGSFGGLQARSVVGDGLDLHHMPQRAAGFTSSSQGGALAMPQAQHMLTRTYGFRGAQALKADAGLSFRQVLARDIWDVRSIAGSSYNQGLRDLIGYYRTNFPELMARGGGL